jgi:hypothetical protein
LLVNGLPVKRFAHNQAPNDFEGEILQALRDAASKEL